MSGAVGTALVAGVGGMLIASQMSKPPSMPSPQAPAAAPQASKAPTAQAVGAGQVGAGQAGGAPGVAQTFLTGAGGIDPNNLQLGKTTLLGG